VRAGIHNITVDCGAVYELDITIANDDGTGYNLTGFTPYMQIRKERNPFSSLLVDCNSYITVLDPLTGSIRVRIPDTATKDITTKKGYYDLEIKSTSGEYRVLKGMVSFDFGVIR
jgi:hypothetical protein